MSEPLDYRADASMRRLASCWVAGTIASISIAIVSVFVIPLKHAFLLVLVSLVFAAGTARVLPTLFWRLRLDSTGIGQRRWFRWEWWTWDEFAAGRIHKVWPYKLVNPERPWGRRTIDLGNLSEPELDEMIEAVNSCYQLPPPPPKRESLTLKRLARGVVNFDQHFVRVSRRRKVREYSWREVKHAKIERLDLRRRDFDTLTLVLPDDEITWFHNPDLGGASWRGATPEEINEFVFTKLPPERIEESIAYSPPTTRTEIEVQLESLRKRRRRVATQQFLGFAVMTFFLFGLVTNFDAPSALLMTTVFVFIPSALFTYVGFSMRARIAGQRAELLARLDSADDVESRAP